MICISAMNFGFEDVHPGNKESEKNDLNNLLNGNYILRVMINKINPVPENSSLFGCTMNLWIVT